MAETTANPVSQKTPKEWTLMFYFASDNALAPGIVSQLKSIKQAGFHLDANVIAHFDPRVGRVPINVFEVNLIEKIKFSAKSQKQLGKIGFTSQDFAPGETPIPSLTIDKLWEEDANRDLIRMSLGPLGDQYDPPRLTSKNGRKSPDPDGEESSPRRSLGSFLRFCRENYPAKRYMLFLLGHGLVVGNDVFLFDEHAAKRHSLALSELGELLTSFKTNIGRDQSVLELVSFHSCSMSALEVAYELKGTANYMLASQGPAFVGSWPYRQILMRIFDELMDKERSAGDAVKERPVKETLKKVFSDCMENSFDFQLAGYSFDLALCDLNKVGDIKTPLSEMSKALTDGLREVSMRNRILLSHWEAQSYWQESYTDLYDFCLRLSSKCKPQSAVAKACANVMRILAKGDDQIIIDSKFVGPAYQYSRGLSVFYPWSQPVNGQFWPMEYRRYQLNLEAQATSEPSWADFLIEYFNETRRDSRGTEEQLKNQVQGKLGKKRPTTRKEPPSLARELLETIATLRFEESGQLAKADPNDKTDAPTPIKGGPGDPTGDDSEGPSIKNFPPFTAISPELLIADGKVQSVSVKGKRRAATAR